MSNSIFRDYHNKAHPFTLLQLPFSKQCIVDARLCIQSNDSSLSYGTAYISNLSITQTGLSCCLCIDTTTNGKVTVCTFTNVTGYGYPLEVNNIFSATVCGYIKVGLLDASVVGSFNDYYKLSPAAYFIKPKSTTDAETQILKVNGEAHLVSGQFSVLALSAIKTRPCKLLGKAVAKLLRTDTFLDNSFISLTTTSALVTQTLLGTNTDGIITSVNGISTILSTPTLCIISAHPEYTEATLRQVDTTAVLNVFGYNTVPNPYGNRDNSVKEQDASE